MTTSKDTPPNEAYVWIWLPRETLPVVAGKLIPRGDVFVFHYGQSYLARDDAIPLYVPELPLREGVIPLLGGLKMPNCLRDASPDAWGRRVILNRKMGSLPHVHVDLIDELTYLLESGSDRIGALDFQHSPTVYEPREPSHASLEDLLEASERIEKGLLLNPQLDKALRHGTSIGGARPKALIHDGEKKYIAKFSSSNDLYSVVKAEFIAMKLAKLCRLDVAPVSLITSASKDVLLIERFDRVKSKKGWQRKAMVSGLTLMQLDEMMARYASYEGLAEIIRYRFQDPKKTLQKLFSRLCFNILVGNTDDHARNHAAFWDGETLQLTPAYDICPQARTGLEASQAMLITGAKRQSQFSTCLDAASHFLLTEKEALAIIECQIQTLLQNWDSLCKEAALSEMEQKLFWKRQFLNSFAFQNLDKDRDSLLKLLPR